MDTSQNDKWTLDKVNLYAKRFTIPDEILQKQINDLVMSLITPVDISNCPSNSVRRLKGNNGINISCALSIAKFIEYIELCTSKLAGFYTTGIRSHVWIFYYVGKLTDLWTVEFFDSSNKYRDNIKRINKLRCSCPYRQFCYIKGKNTEYNCFKMDIRYGVYVMQDIEINNDKFCYVCKSYGCPDPISDRDKRRKIHFYARLITGQDRCVRSVLFFICILRFRRNEISFKGLINYDVIRMIGKYIHRTKDDNIWKR